MRIGIDIDDTLTNTSESFDRVMQKYNVNFNKSFKEEWTEEEQKFIYSNYLKEILTDVDLKEDAKEVVQYLNSLGHYLVIITARSNKHCKDIEQKTIELLNKENIDINEIYFGQRKKSDLAKKLNIDLMIDDNKFVYDNMQAENIDCILFGSDIKTWKEVLEYINSKGGYDG